MKRKNTTIFLVVMAILPLCGCHLYNYVDFTVVDPSGEPIRNAYLCNVTEPPYGLSIPLLVASICGLGDVVFWEPRPDALRADGTGRIRGMLRSDWSSDFYLFSSGNGVDSNYFYVLFADGYYPVELDHNEYSAFDLEGESPVVERIKSITMIPRNVNDIPEGCGCVISEARGDSSLHTFQYKTGKIPIMAKEPVKDKICDELDWRTQGGFLRYCNGAHEDYREDKALEVLWLPGLLDENEIEHFREQLRLRLKLDGSL